MRRFLHAVLMWLAAIAIGVGFAVLMVFILLYVQSYFG